MTTLLRAAADFDAVPDEALVLTIEVVLPEVPHARRRTLWQKFGHGYVALDPSDRNNGEEIKQPGYLENLLTGFGNKRTVPGIAILLGEGEQIAYDALDDLPFGSIIQVGGEECPHQYNGPGRWSYLDPADPYDGDYPATTVNLISGDPVIRVLYRHGDEERAGFVPEAEVPPKTTTVAHRAEHTDAFAVAETELLTRYPIDTAEGRALRILSGYRTEYDALHRELAKPPAGWFNFGHHVTQPDVALVFWGEIGGLPLWERPADTDPLHR